MRASADSRILRGYSIDDIDMPTLHQYRRAYDIKCEYNHWTQADDKQFLSRNGAMLLGNMIRSLGDGQGVLPRQAATCEVIRQRLSGGAVHLSF